MKQNEKLLIASALSGIISIFFGAISLFIFYRQWPFYGYDILNDNLKGDWVGKGGILLSAILVSTVFVLISILLLVIYDRAKVQRSTVVWNGGLLLLIQLVMALCMLRYWEDVIGFVPLSSGVYFFGFVQGAILCFARGEQKQ